MNPGNPRNIEASIRQKLLNVATRNREDFGLILTRYALEPPLPPQPIEVSRSLCS